MGDLERLAGELYSWTPILAELAGCAGEPHGPHGPHVGGHSAQSAGPVVQAVERRNEIESMADRLAELAAEAFAAHSGEETPMPRTHPACVLMSLAGWLAKQPMGVDIAREVEAIHSQASRIIGFAPDKDESKCPRCVQFMGADAPAMQRMPEHDGLPDIYTCHACGYVGNRDTYSFTQRARIMEQAERATGVFLKPAEAAELAGVPAATVRTWKHRAEVRTDNMGRVCVADVAWKARK